MGRGRACNCPKTTSPRGGTGQRHVPRTRAATQRTRRGLFMYNGRSKPAWPLLPSMHTGGFFMRRGGRSPIFSYSISAGRRRVVRPYSARYLRGWVITPHIRPYVATSAHPIHRSVVVVEFSCPKRVPTRAKPHNTKRQTAAKTTPQNTAGRPQRPHMLTPYIYLAGETRSICPNLSHLYHPRS